MRVSIKDIAQAAGVSHSTVSRALSHSPLVNDQTAARIRRLAQDMGYAPSAIARSLVTKRTRTIGLVVTTIADPFVAEVVRGIEEAALDAGYSVLLANSNAEPQREMAAVRAFREKWVDGVIVTASRVGDLYLPLLEEIKAPIVLINNHHDGEYVHTVGTDNVAGAQLAVNYLIELGHRRIAYIGDAGGGQSDADRLEGYRRALASAGLPWDEELLAPGNGCIDGSEEPVRRLLSLPNPPTALFCYNDMTAIGAYRALKALGYSIPGDISVIGFDDIAFAAYVDPPLTTVAQKKYEMGRLATAMLLELLDSTKEVTNILLPGELVIRASCRAI